MKLQLITENKQKILEEAFHLKQDTIFETIDRINDSHDAIHRHILIHVVQQQPNVHSSSYCWLDMGSGGRGERTLWTDQDNGMMFENGLSDIDSLHSIATETVQLLAQGGYPLCKGGVMASNARWFQPVIGWQQNWILWNEQLSLDTIRFLLIAWDMRPIYGGERMVEEFKRWGLPVVQSSLKRLASHSLHHPLPIGIFGRIFTPTHGEHTGMFHLKEGGYYQLVSLIRLLSLDGGIIDSSTRGRIRSLSAVGYLSPQEANELEEALAFFLFLRLKLHASLYQKGESFHDYISLTGCDKSLQAQLKHHIQTIRKQQNDWRKRFRL